MLTECCDVIVAHSPPLFTSHNAQPELSVLYQNFRLVMTHKPQSPPVSVRRYNKNGQSSCSPTRENKQNTPAKPRRPCLVVRTDSEGSIGSSSSSGLSSDENEPSSPIKRKKKVVFADDRGLSLTQVRLMNEPSNQPPKLMVSSPYLNNCGQSSVCANGGLTTTNKQPDQQWKLNFSQPASSYLDFRKRLDVGNISLENVIVKSPDRRIVGTVKVRNLSYDKEVFVRSTQDKWSTHADTLCTYVQNNTMVNNGSGPSAPSGHGQNVTAIYDTFSFRLQLPTDATSMEFAVCYKSADFEFWDNNDGTNYCLSLNGGQPAGPHHHHHRHHNQQPPQPLLSPSCLTPSLADFDHQKQNNVHYFGVQSRQNSWTTWRDQKNDNSAYW